MWKLYDDLIADIPDDLIVDSYSGGDYFAMMEAGTYAGVAHCFSQESRPMMNSKPVVGRSLRDLAIGIKSWNFKEASWGMMAINTYYNSYENVKKLGILSCLNDNSLESRRLHNPLNNSREKLAGKKVAVIGHFRNIEYKLQKICDLHILEMNPEWGDYPSSACEYLLPEMDYIFATGTSIVNKTLPRLLELKGENSIFTLVGPSGPLTPIMFDYGVDVVASFVVTDRDHVRDILSNNKRGMFDGGQMVEYGRDL